jgi:glutaminyl-peptide cyclotransferase
MDKTRLIVIVVFLVAVLVCASVLVLEYKPKSAESDNTPKIFTYKIEKIYPHNPNAFTEGLTFEDNNTLLESTGLFGASSLRRVNLETGVVTKNVTLNSSFFGEGITVVNDSIIQLTWQNHVGFVYDRETFVQINQFTYSMDGWGLTFDGENLVLSDGTSKLYFLNPSTFQVTREINVRQGTSPVSLLNELEYVNGSIYANIWKQNKIAIIQPESGQITSWIDLTGLYNPEDANQVLNGIAYNPQNDALIVTGKNWPNLYQIQLKPQN